MRDGETVVVPARAGPLIRPRPRDDLDEVIDDLLPEVDGGPGWFDLLLVGGGTAAMVWALGGSAPSFVLVVGVAAVVLGALLPMRWAWRRLRPRPTPLVLATSDPDTNRLVAAYEALEGPVEAVAAAHSAVVEVATLLDGREPASDRERDYVVRRAAAIEDLTAALHAERGTNDALVEAREELEAFGDVGTVARLERLALEARLHGGHGPAPFA